jgi:DNA recombination protein RmuC
MSSVEILSILLAVGLAAFLSFLLTRLKYAVRLAATDSLSAQLGRQLTEKANELNSLRSQLANETTQRTMAETKLAEEQRSLLRQKQILEEAESKLSSVFEGLAGTVLSANSSKFLDLANASLKGGAVRDLQGLVKPIEEMLSVYKSKLDAIEIARVDAYSKIDMRLATVGAAQETLRSETAKLINALSRPYVRGRWGEMTLKRVAELTGMIEHCDFDLQPTIATEDGNLRPDMIVYLPKEMIVPVDSKVPFDSYMEAGSAISPEEQKRHLKQHAARLRERMNNLASKEYQKQFRVAPDVTVLFLPNEGFLAAALEHDPTLLEDGLQKKILFATPASLFSLLMSAAYGWQQEAIAHNAQEISDLGKLLCDRMETFCEHLSKMREGLVKATESFDKAVGSLNRNVLPTARKFRQLGATTTVVLEDVDLVARDPRPLAIARVEIKNEK